MLDLVPGVNGTMLTFIETGARIEDQFSKKLTRPEEKLAALIDAEADVIINESKMKLYIRTFIYNRTELTNLLGCIGLIKNPNVIVMTKETPHDFFVTHPVSWWTKDVKLPVIVEFDCAHEFNGQSIVASIFPEVHLNRWKYYQKLPNVIGYSIRTDRYGDTSIIGRPSEINLYAVCRAAQEPAIDIEKIYDEFITKRYGKESLTLVKAAFKKAPDIMTSVYYSLGLNTANHSRLDFDYRSIYVRHVSGRWLENPVIFVAHGVDKELHYWRDIVNHLAPAKHKTASGTNQVEIPEVLENKWIQAQELMNEEYLSYVVKEKEYGVQLARQALDDIRSAKEYIKDAASYSDLYDTFERTLLSARLRLAASKAYYGYRIYARGAEYRTESLKK